MNRILTRLVTAITVTGITYLILLLALAAPVAALDVRVPRHAPAEMTGITQDCTITSAPPLDNPKYLTDGDYRTAVKIKSGTRIRIECTTGIGGIYIIWDRCPAPFTLLLPAIEPLESAVNNEMIPEYTGNREYLHELISLTRESNYVEILIGDENASISGFYIFAPKQLPPWVHRWSSPLNECDLLVLSAHADDEFLWFGGTIPVYAGEYGLKVQVAYLTRHGVGSRAERDYMRNHEMLDALWRSGVRNYPLISAFPDEYAATLTKAKEMFGEDRVIEYAVELLRRCKPKVVLTHGEKGEYGHGAHALAAHAMKKALPLSGNAAKYPGSAQQYGIWTVSKAYLHQYSKNPIVMNWDVPLAKFGGKTGFQMAKDSYRCHISQQEKWFAVAPRGSEYDCYSFGLYYTNVGEDIRKNDFFENVLSVIPHNVSAPVATHTTAVSTIPETTSAAIVETTTAIVSTTVITGTTVSAISQTLVQPTINTSTEPSSFSFMIRILLVLACVLIAVATGYFLIRRARHKNNLI